MQQTYDCVRVNAALPGMSGDGSVGSDAESKRSHQNVPTGTLASDIVGHGERRTEDGIAISAAGEQNIADCTCDHLRFPCRSPKLPFLCTCLRTRPRSEWEVRKYLSGY
jgi:hypothetical protein